MSTYLVAFGNGPFEFVESAYKSPLSGVVRPLRVYGAPVCPPDARQRCSRLSSHAGSHTEVQIRLGSQGEGASYLRKGVCPSNCFPTLAQDRLRMFNLEYPLPKLDTLIAGEAQGAIPVECFI
jgi:hypothetical protein